MARARMAVTLPDTYRSLWSVFVKTVKDEGPRGLYRGYVPTILGVIPYAGTGFFTYETLKRLHFGKLVKWLQIPDIFRIPEIFPQNP